MAQPGAAGSGARADGGVHRQSLLSVKSRPIRIHELDMARNFIMNTLPDLLWPDDASDHHQKAFAASTHEELREQFALVQRHRRDARWSAACRGARAIA